MEYYYEFKTGCGATEAYRNVWFFEEDFLLMRGSFKNSVSEGFGNALLNEDKLKAKKVSPMTVQKHLDAK